MQPIIYQFVRRLKLQLISISVDLFGATPFNPSAPSPGNNTVQSPVQQPVTSPSNPFSPATQTGDLLDRITRVVYIVMGRKPRFPNLLPQTQIY